MAGSTIDLRIASAASRRPRSRVFVRVAIVVAAAAIAAALALLPDPARAAGNSRHFCLPHENAGMVSVIVEKK